ncbi:MAG TPA: hypothetical protein VE988_00100 [Gemmataceae bacterium]|nr:hypothetical protein [Gemmataceae bacterium]
MVATLDECYVVFVRDEDRSAGNPSMCERELVKCATHEQAEWVRRECTRPRRKCIIRYVGPTGGGD